MWLTSFERFFRIKNQPLSDRETRQLALRNWSEELRLVDNVILRVVQLCSAILTEEQVNLTRFDQYLEGYLKKDDMRRPLHREAAAPADAGGRRSPCCASPSRTSTCVLNDLVKLSRIPYATFTAVGKMIYREIRRSHLLALLHRQEVQAHPRPHHQPAGGGRRARRSSRTRERKHAAKVFLEFFRLLHYLEYADPERDRRGGPQEHDPGLLAHHLRDAAAAGLPREAAPCAGLDPSGPLYQLYDSFVYCMPLELKKVINTELLDISVARQAESIRDAGGEQPRHPEGLLPAVGGAAGPGLRPRGRRAATSSRTSRPSSTSPCACATAWPRW